MMGPVFEAGDISKSFGVVRALIDVSISLDAGQVHAVVGENGAGKSTLMNIFCGKLAPTSGQLRRQGRPIRLASPLQAQEAGIAIAPQEVSLVPDLSVAENVLLGSQVTSRAGIDWHRTRERAIGYLKEVDDTIDPDARAGRLSKAQQQLIQIARAIAVDPQILILDEPTAALASRETVSLFSFIRKLRSRGGSIFYISHRLDEVLEVADRVTVLRDGKVVSELDPAATSKDEIVRHMAGRATAAAAPVSRKNQLSEVVLSVRNLTRPGEFADISFDLHKSEILGVAGLVGSGRTELGKCIFGVTHAISGEIRMFGERTVVAHPAEAINRGLVYLPEERKQEGIFPLLSVTENMSIPAMDRFASILGLRASEMVREVDKYIERMRIKLGRQSDPITSLSGGNQQKVILARWLMRNSRILILDEPTRGIDISAKREIQALLRSLATEGLSIVYISSELEEVLEVSDRILVMHEGRVKGIQVGHEATQETLLAQAIS